MPEYDPEEQRNIDSLDINQEDLLRHLLVPNESFLRLAVKVAVQDMWSVLKAAAELLEWL
jgi:hypothetical protein